LEKRSRDAPKNPSRRRAFEPGFKVKNPWDQWSGSCRTGLPHRGILQVLGPVRKVQKGSLPDPSQTGLRRCWPGELWEGGGGWDFHFGAGEKGDQHFLEGAVLCSMNSIGDLTEIWRKGGRLKPPPKEKFQISPPTRSRPRADPPKGENGKNLAD